MRPADLDKTSLALPQRPLPAFEDDPIDPIYFRARLRPIGVHVVARSATRQSFPAAPWRERLRDFAWRLRNPDAPYQPVDEVVLPTGRHSI